MSSLQKFYTKKVLQHFKNPRNFGSLKNPDGLGKVGNPVCGDVMHLYIRVGKNKKKQKIIKNIKFETFGCVAAIAVSSMITDLAKGKTLEEAKRITKNNLAEKLGGLPPIKMHCSGLAIDALHAAIKDYEKRFKVKKTKWLHEKDN